MPDVTADLLLAVEHARAGRLAQADRLSAAVLAVTPDHPHALFLRGECALLAGRLAKASEMLGQALLGRPNHRQGRIALVRALLAQGRAAEALATLAPLAADTRFAPGHSLRGSALSMLGRPGEAVEAFTLALSTAPGDPEVHLNLGNAYEALDQPEPAERHIRRALDLKPDFAEAHASLGHLLTGLGRVAEAAACNVAAIALRPDLAVAHWNLGVALLLGGDMAAGWREYEWRKRQYPASFRTLPGPQWDGGPVSGRTILVMAEQGYGDTLQFARYLPLLARRGAHVVVECPATLRRLIGLQPGVAQACEKGRRPSYDAWVDQMSLPLLFSTTAETVPMAGGYLAVDQGLARRWDAILPQGLRVGLVWAGNPLHSNDRRRSMPASALAPVLAVTGVQFIGLQVGRPGGLPGVLDLTPELTDWTVTAAVVSTLSLVITVDTAVAHLAGALGIPTWLMLPAAPDWRWMLGRDDSPWYRSMRLFRQQRAGDWDAVIGRVAAALADLVPPYTIAMPPLTCSVAPVTQPASSDAR